MEVYWFEAVPAFTPSGHKRGDDVSEGRFALSDGLNGILPLP